MKNLKDKLNNLELILISAIALVTPSCDNSYTLHREALEKYTPITKEQKDSLFNNLNSGLKEYINKIYFIDEKDFFEDNILAHAHREDQIICLSKNYKNYSDGTLFHESAHLRHDALDKIGFHFSEKWKQIADFEYGEENTKSY